MVASSVSTSDYCIGILGLRSYYAQRRILFDGDMHKETCILYGISAGRLHINGILEAPKYKYHQFIDYYYNNLLYYHIDRTLAL